MPPTTIHVRPTGVPDETTPGIETRELARLFRRSPALAGVTMRVEAGRAVAVLGANGAGKSTLLRILATALRPSYGAALVDGIDVAERPEEIRPRVVLLPHANGLYDDLTAAENLAFAARLMRIPSPDRAGRIAAALDRVQLTDVRDDRVGRFSAGMRRRLALGQDPARPPAPGPARRAVRGARRRWHDPRRRSPRRMAHERGHRPGGDPCRRTPGARESTAGCGSSTGSWPRSAGRVSTAGR